MSHQEECALMTPLIIAMVIYFIFLLDQDPELRDESSISNTAN